MKIEFYNRDGIRVWLEEIENEWWQLRINPSIYFEYTRFIFDKGEKIYAVDPPGGPFLSIGLVCSCEKYKV